MEGHPAPNSPGITSVWPFLQVTCYLALNSRFYEEALGPGEVHHLSGFIGPRTPLVPAALIYTSPFTLYFYLEGELFIPSG